MYPSHYTPLSPLPSLPCTCLPPMQKRQRLLQAQCQSAVCQHHHGRQQRPNRPTQCQHLRLQRRRGQRPRQVPRRSQVREMCPQLRYPNCPVKIITVNDDKWEEAACQRLHTVRSSTESSPKLLVSLTSVGCTLWGPFSTFTVYTFSCRL